MKSVSTLAAMSWTSRAVPAARRLKRLTRSSRRLGLRLSRSSRSQSPTVARSSGSSLPSETGGSRPAKSGPSTSSPPR